MFQGRLHWAGGRFLRHVLLGSATGSKSKSDRKQKQKAKSELDSVDGGVGATGPTELTVTWERIRKTEMSQSGSSGLHLRSPQRHATSKTGRSHNLQGADGVIDV